MSNAKTSTTTGQAGTPRTETGPREFEFLPKASSVIEPLRESDFPPIVEDDLPETEEEPAPVAVVAAPVAVKKKRSPLFRLVLIVLAICAALWVANFIHHMMVYEETDDAYIDGHIHQISSRVGGSVTEVLVKENQPVKKGQVLARIDPLEFEIAMQEAKASVAEAQAGSQAAQAALAQAKAQETQLQAQEQSAEAQVQQITAQLAVANVNFGRDQRLFQSDVRAVSKADVDTTQSAAQASTAALAGAKADVTAAQARAQAGEAAVESAQATVTSAQAKIDAGQAAVRDAERNLSYTAITSPSDGRIGNKNIEVGNRVQVGQALFAVVDNDCWITANFKETQLKKMSDGQPVEITVDAIGGHVFTGKLDSISPASGAEFALLPPDNATGNFTKVVQRVPAKITFDADSTRGYEDKLRPGLSTLVSVKVK